MHQQSLTSESKFNKISMIATRGPGWGSSTHFRCSIIIRDTDTVLLGVIYRSPRSSEAKDASLMKLLMQARSFGAKYLLITSDFNFPNVNWSNWSTLEWDMA